MRVLYESMSIFDNILQCGRVTSQYALIKSRNYLLLNMRMTKNTIDEPKIKLHHRIKYRKMKGVNNCTKMMAKPNVVRHRLPHLQLLLCSSFLLNGCMQCMKRIAVKHACCSVMSTSNIILRTLDNESK